MDIVTIILGIYAIITTIGAGIFAWLLLREKNAAMDTEKRNRTEREALVRQNEILLTTRTDKFLLDIEKLTDKLLKTRGLSPIHETREPKEPTSNRFESTLTRKAREKHDLYNK